MLEKQSLHVNAEYASLQEQIDDGATCCELGNKICRVVCCRVGVHIPALARACFRSSIIHSIATFLIDLLVINQY